MLDLRCSRDMRPALALLIALVSAACATPAVRSPEHAPARAPAPATAPTTSAVERLARLRTRRTWPSEADRRRWEQALDAADRAGAGLAYEPPLPSPDFASAVDTVEQLDALFRIGESARTPR